MRVGNSEGEQDGDVIEFILKNCWVKDNKHSFLIKFKNYPASDAEWIPEADMSANEFVLAYEKLNPRSKDQPRK